VSCPLGANAFNIALGGALPTYPLGRLCSPQHRDIGEFQVCLEQRKCLIRSRVDLHPSWPSEVARRTDGLEDGAIRSYGSSELCLRPKLLAGAQEREGPPVSCQSRRYCGLGSQSWLLARLGSYDFAPPRTVQPLACAQRICVLPVQVCTVLMFQV
jgi:hypothetical protein